MADNITLNPGALGPAVATEDISGIHMPRTKLVLGISGVDGGNITTSNPVPTTDSKLPAASALTDAFSNPTTTLLGANLLGFNGTTWDRLRSDITNGLDVDVTRVSGSVTVSRSSSVSPSTQISTDAYVTVSGTSIDTQKGERSISFRLAEMVSVNGITFKIQGSVDTVNFRDLFTLDENAVKRSSVEIAISAGSNTHAFLTNEFEFGVHSAYRTYRVVVKSTIAGMPGTADVDGFAK